MGGREVNLNLDNAFKYTGFFLEYNNNNNKNNNKNDNNNIQASADPILTKTQW